MLHGKKFASEKDCSWVGQSILIVGVLFEWKKTPLKLLSLTQHQMHNLEEHKAVSEEHENIWQGTHLFEVAKQIEETEKVTTCKSNSLL